MTGNPFPVFVDERVRFRDTDAMGHVNNAVYLSYLEVARMKYWFELTGTRDFKKVDFILARAEIDYRSPATAGEELRVWIRISRLGRSSFTFLYRVEELGSARLVAEASTVQACYDYGKGKIKRLDDSLKLRIGELEGRAL